MNHVGDLISGLEDTVEELEQTFKENEKFKRTHENKIQHIWYRVKKKQPTIMCVEEEEFQGK